MFDNPKKVNLNIDQGGMIILSRDKGKVKVEHSFETFGEFIRPFYIRK